MSKKSHRNIFITSKIVDRLKKIDESQWNTKIKEIINKKMDAKEFNIYSIFELNVWDFEDIILTETESMKGLEKVTVFMVTLNITNKNRYFHFNDGKIKKLTEIIEKGKVDD